MPPRRSARVAAVAEQRSRAFPQLPLHVELLTFSFLPADQRLRCAEVSRGWRATVAQPALWRRVDLSPASGVAQPSLALLLAALRRAGGALKALDVSGTDLYDVREICDALHAPGALEEFHAAYSMSVAELNVVLAAAPQLRELHADVHCSLTDAVDLLEHRPPFAPLRLHELTLLGNVGGEALSPALAAALADTRLQPSLVHLTLVRVVLLAPDALADAVVIARRLRALAFSECVMPASAAQALARMLRDGALTELEFESGNEADDDMPPFDAAGAATLFDALRANTTLTKLSVLHLWPARRTMTALISSLVGHHSLRHLNLCGTQLEPAAGAALYALVAADAPALTVLNLWGCWLTLNVLGMLCDALPRNTHLRTLEFNSCRPPLPAGFIAHHLLPAVRANSSLRHLIVSNGPHADGEAEVREAQRIVAER